MRKLSFSQRNRMTPVRVDFQTEGIDEKLRTALWNSLYRTIFSKNSFSLLFAEEESIAYSYWVDFKGGQINEIPNWQYLLHEIERDFFGNEWFFVYDLIEFFHDYLRDITIDVPNALIAFSDDINEALERELSGYRLINGTITAIIDSHEVDSIQSAACNNDYASVSIHINAALKMLADRKEPDYRNSIRESITAVECMARIITGKPKATLGDALKEIEKHVPLHPSLKSGFDKIYGYTCDEGGLRHSFVDEKNEFTQADARYFLVSCSAFVNYLKELSSQK